jgi:hypothetical protein
MARVIDVFTNALLRIFFVMRGLDPRIHRSAEILAKKMDCRVKPGNDASV